MYGSKCRCRGVYVFPHGRGAQENVIASALCDGLRVVVDGVTWVLPVFSMVGGAAEMPLAGFLRFSDTPTEPFVFNGFDGV